MRFKLSAFADEADGKLQEQIKALKENDIQYLEIRGIDGKNIDGLTNDEAKEIRKKLDEADIKVWSLGSPFGKIGITEKFNEHLESFKHSLELADILGAEKIRIFSFYVPADKKAVYHDEVFSRMSKFIEAAKGSNVMLCHENEKDIYGDIAECCYEIHKEFPTIKAVFDIANYIQCNQNVVKAWEMLSPYVEYLHIKDALADGTVVPAGKGIGNMSYILEQYKGTILTVEPHLAVFEGLDKLEQGEKSKLGYYYPSPRAAFDAAVDALKVMINN